MEDLNSQRLTNHRQQELETDEISLYDLVSALLEQWKMVFFVAALGLLAGILGWWLKGYDVELKARPVLALNFVEWRKMSAGLPALANERWRLLNSDSANSGLYYTLSRSEWWSTNVTPVYRFSKNDIKELGAISKIEQDEGATAIDTVVFRANASNVEDAVNLVRGAEEFVREGGLFIALSSLLARYDLEQRKLSTELRAKTSKEENELSYLNKRASALDVLLQKYPEKSIASIQAVMDPKDNAAKYLPLGTQLVAVKTEINSLEESLSRTRDRLEESRIANTFVNKALPLLRTEPNGFTLANQLKTIEAEIRSGVDPTNKPQIIAIDQIAAELNSTQQRFQSLFEGDTPISSWRVSKSLPMALSLIGGLLAGVLVVFIRTAWRRSKRASLAA